MVRSCQEMRRRNSLMRNHRRTAGWPVTSGRAGAGGERTGTGHTGSRNGQNMHLDGNGGRAARPGIYSSGRRPSSADASVLAITAACCDRRDGAAARANDRPARASCSRPSSTSATWPRAAPAAQQRAGIAIFGRSAGAFCTQLHSLTMAIGGACAVAGRVQKSTGP